MREEINNEVLENVSGGAGSASKHAIIVNCDVKVHVRQLPDKDAPIVGSARLGDTYEFFGWSGSWAKVQYGEHKAYIYKNFIKVVNS